MVNLLQNKKNVIVFIFFLCYRLFKGHSAPVHRTHFMHCKPQVCSFSDDKTVKIWDIPTEKNLITYSDHNDYIRAGATCLSMPDIILSGGYDGIIRMYDCRTENEILNVNHGSPVESLLFLPSGGIFLTAGGTQIKIWDSIAGGKQLGSISQHHKTITCLKLASDNKRLLSSSLDRHVKVYDVATFQTVYTLNFPNAVLSLGVSKNDDTLVAGLVDGLVSVSRREEKNEENPQKKISSFRYSSTSYPASVDNVISEIKLEKEAKYDRHLRKFEYSKALDDVLLPYIANKFPEITVSVIQELIRRRAFDKALSGRGEKCLTQTLRFITRNITDYRFTKVLINAAHIFIDIYEDLLNTFPPEVGKLLIDLYKVLNQEIELSNDLAEIQGMMNMLLASQVNVDDTNVNERKGHDLIPSADAQKNLILTIS